MKFYNVDIYLAFYSKLGELYIDIDNISKATECQSRCQIIAKDTYQNYENFKLLSALIDIKIEKHNAGINALLKLLQNSASADVFDYCFKNRVIKYLLKYIAPKEYENVLFPLLLKNIDELFGFSELFKAEFKFHKSLICLKSAMFYASELIRNKVAVPKYLEILINLAKMSYDFGFHNKALQLFEQGMYFVETENISGELFYKLHIGAIRTLSIMKNYPRAFTLIDKLEKRLEYCEDIEYQVRLYYEKALCKSKFGNDKEALQIFKYIEEKLLEHCKYDFFKARYKAKINNQKCFILLKNYEIKKAVELYNQSLKGLNAYRHTFEYAETLCGIAQTLSANEIHADSLKFFMTAFNKFYENYSINRLINSMQLISKHYIRAGDINEAMYYIDEAIRILEIRENIQELPLLYSQKAKIYLLQNLYQKAEEFFKKDLSITKQTENIHSLAFSYYHLGLVYQKQDMTNIAETYLKKSLEYFNVIDNPNNKILVLLQLAINNAKIGLVKYVTKYLNDAENCWKYAKNRLLQAHILLVKGICYTILNKRGKQIEELFKSAIKLYENLDPLNNDLIEAYYELSIYYEKTANFKDAINCLKSSIEICKKIGLFEKVNFLLEKLNQLSELETQKMKLLSMTGADNDYVEENDNALKVSNKYLVIFFVDIRGFTTISENLEIAKLESLLNDFYTSVTKIITQNNGIINKFIGDSVLALFNMSGNDNNPEEKAIKSAKEILIRLEGINQRRKNTGEPIIEIGIGINAGNVLLGAFGSFQRLEYTAIGDAVNTAARLQDLAKKNEVLITESV
ncbi:MAG TPA: tetratricopeptide repeat protein, partial [bacterium]|nr:tetratricopeptide repeat protein [bacterium]